VRHERKHSSEKPLTCSECSYATANKGNLTRHQRTHSGEKPFKCSQCFYTAARKDHLVAHQQTHFARNCSVAQSVLMLHLGNQNS
jgi:KRAB domain-containing zinc finger protein